MTERIGPSHQLVADDIRSRIISGEYEVGAVIPSTPKLAKQYTVSTTVVRHAVERLRADGILIGHPGKGVYVKARPDDAASSQYDSKALREQVAKLRADLAAVATQVEATAELREIVEHLQANLIELYGKTGFDYPDAGATGRGKWQSRRARHG